MSIFHQKPLLGALPMWSPNPAGIPPPVGAWVMNEGSGLPFDATGSLDPPTLITGNPAWGDGGINFSSTVISYGDVDVITGKTMTVIMSIKPTTWAQTSGILNKRIGFDNQNAYGFGLRDSVPDYWNVALGGASGDFVNPLAYNWDSTGWSTTEYSQISSVVDMNLGANLRAKCWRNGVLLPLLAADNDNSFDIFNSTSNVEIGRVNDAALYYSGRIRYIWLYNQALTPAQIHYIHTNPYYAWDYTLDFPIWMMVAEVAPSGVVPFKRQLLMGVG